jgi:hypothetical protein
VGRAAGRNFPAGALDDCGANIVEKFDNSRFFCNCFSNICPEHADSYLLNLHFYGRAGQPAGSFGSVLFF